MYLFQRILAKIDKMVFKCLVHARFIVTMMMVMIYTPQALKSFWKVWFFLAHLSSILLEPSVSGLSLLLWKVFPQHKSERVSELLTVHQGLPVSFRVRPKPSMWG